jgi:hypothetical protein
MEGMEERGGAGEARVEVAPLIISVVLRRRLALYPRRATGRLLSARAASSSRAPPSRCVRSRRRRPRAGPSSPCAVPPAAGPPRGRVTRVRQLVGCLVDGRAACAAPLDARAPALRPHCPRIRCVVHAGGGGWCGRKRLGEEKNGEDWGLGSRLGFAPVAFSLIG